MQKLYVLVRSDLSKSQQAVQAGHAVAAWCLQEAARWHWNGRDVITPPWRWENGTLVYLKVRDESELKEYLEAAAGPSAEFYEPDLGGELTAVAILEEIGKYEHLKLL